MASPLRGAFCGNNFAYVDKEFTDFEIQYTGALNLKNYTKKATSTKGLRKEYHCVELLRAENDVVSGSREQRSEGNLSNSATI